MHDMLWVYHTSGAAVQRKTVSYCRLQSHRTNLFEAESYFLDTDQSEGKLVSYTLLEERIFAEFVFNYFVIIRAI